VCCICLNKVSGDAARKVMPEFFKRFPGPRYVIGQVRHMEEVLRPLGFQRQRSIRIISMSAVFDTFEDGHQFNVEQVASLPGIGKYALDSFRILILGETEYEEPLDKKLKEWLEA